MRHSAQAWDEKHSDCVEIVGLSVLKSGAGGPWCLGALEPKNRGPSALEPRNPGA